MNDNTNIKDLLSSLHSLLKARYGDDEIIQNFHTVKKLIHGNNIKESDCIQKALKIAIIAVSEINIDMDSIVAMLLDKILVIPDDRHIESIPYISDDIKSLLMKIRKTSELYNKTQTFSSENFHNLLLSIADDIRVILLLISEKLYLLRNAKYLKNDEERLCLALEVSNLYAPISHRLGLYQIKGEMEDLSFKYRDRKTFNYIKKKLGETKDEREAYIEKFITPLKTLLDKSLNNISYSIKSRTKSISSISNKLKKVKYFSEIYDLFAIRIILDVPLENERQYCWQVYSIVTDLYRPNPERMKDWISIPKNNGYESLHTTVIGPDNRWVEVQIRTTRMDEIAERGIAAHWRYKGIKSEKRLDDFMTSVREVLDLIRNDKTNNIKSLLSSSMISLKNEEIYVFTPKGEVIKLPQGSTVLDFAFSIHSKIGSQAISAKVNDKNVSIKCKLKNGDIVNVFTSATQVPKSDWLNIVVSAKAKNRIRQILREEEQKGISIAKEMMQRRLKNRKITLNDSLFVKLIKSKGYKTITDFYTNLLNEKIDLNNFLDLYESLQKKELVYPSNRYDASRSADKFEDTTANEGTINGEIIFMDKGMDGVEYSFAKCCNPVFGDKIFAFISSSGIKIHRFDCANAKPFFEKKGHRILICNWNGHTGSKLLKTIEVIGQDDMSIITYVASVIKKYDNVKIRSYSVDSADGLFKGTFILFMDHKTQLNPIIKKISVISGIKSVTVV